jgi:hypothetical protein
VIYDRIREMLTACLARFGEPDARVHLLTEGNYGNYWLDIISYFSNQPALGPRIVAYHDGRGSQKYITTAENKMLYCGHLRRLFVNRQISVAENMCFWRAGEQAAGVFHGTLVDQMRFFYAYRNYKKDESEHFTLQLTGKKNKKKDDIVMALMLTVANYASVNRNK